uniref:2-alkenal reductase n=1 Tax=Cyanothece sp. (strain PCC 7425 / ATCC 29141) TaxID=395961 RepID=B8HRF6_CYAP4
MSVSDQRFQPLRQLGSYGAIVFLSVVLTIAALWTFPTLLPRSMPLPATVQPVSQLPSQTALTTSPARTTELNFVVNAVNRVGPAVVRIDTERKVVNQSASPFFDDPFFRQFFGEDAFPRVPREYRQLGEGSGFIIDSNGLILTNAHVVSGADKVTVTLKDGRRLTGQVRGVDEPSDLAVVKISGQNLPIAPLGNSSQLQVGDWAIALGNPLGLDNTVTLGIISTLNRSSAQVGIPDKRLDFIQTDAAINPGNSGGPLLNAAGEVIGINTAIRADAQGIGFAIPIDKAKLITDILAKGGKVSHPYIGVRMLTLTPEIAKQSNNDPNSPLTVPEINGVLVVQVMPNSPAATAGLRRGDVITQVEGQTITSAEQLQDIVEKSRIGQPLQMKVRRGNQSQQLTVKPGELQDATPS